MNHLVEILERLPTPVLEREAKTVQSDIDRLTEKRDHIIRILGDRTVNKVYGYLLEE